MQDQNSREAPSCRVEIMGFAAHEKTALARLLGDAGFRGEGENPDCPPSVVVFPPGAATDLLMEHRAAGRAIVAALDPGSAEDVSLSVLERFHGFFFVASPPPILRAAILIAQRRKDAQAGLEAEVARRELFMSELQHRVKNNLALVASLLSLESSLIPGGKERAVFQEAQSRVRAVALFYERLYKAGGSSRIELGPYLHEIVVTVLGNMRGRIALSAVYEPLYLDHEQAVPMGLIVDELSMNVVKYAYPDGGAGRVRVELKRAGAQAVLAFEDDGKGLPEDFTLGSGRGLGSQLLVLLAEQLGGRIVAGTGSGGAGSAFTLTFPCKA